MNLCQIPTGLEPPGVNVKFTVPRLWAFMLNANAWCTIALPSLRLWTLQKPVKICQRETWGKLEKSMNTSFCCVQCALSHSDLTP